MDTDIVRTSWLDGLFDRVVAEFNRLVKESSKGYPSGPVTKIFEDAVGSVITKSFTCEAFSGCNVDDARLRELDVFAMGVLSGQRVFQLIGLDIVVGSWLDGLFNRLWTEYERLQQESQGVGPIALLIKTAVENLITEPFRFEIFQSAQTPVPENLMGALSIFSLGVLSGQRLIKMGHGFKPVPDRDKLQ